MDHLVLVVVRGLRSDDPPSSTHENIFLRFMTNDKYGYIWGSYWLSKMGNGNCHVVSFDAEFQPTNNEPGFLSPSWFDRKANQLLNKVRDSVEGNQQCRIVFCGENFGGIIAKRALVIADADNKYEAISRLTCACILFGVPHKAPSLQAWNHLVTSMVLPFWNFLPEGFWRLTAALPEYLVRTSSDFIAVAFSIAIISVCQPLPDLKIRSSSIINISCGVLDVSHEHVVVHDEDLPLDRITEFALDQDEKVDRIFRIIQDTKVVLPPSREYMKTLSRLSPYTRFPEHDDIQVLVKAIKKKIETSGASNINLYEERGNERSTLSYALYESLIRGRGPTEHAAYFAFDAGDHRRRSVFAMIIKLMRQLLSNEPLLINKFLNERKDDKTSWTEGNLWIQLRSIIRQMQSPRIHLIIDSVNDCETDSQQRLLQNLFDLQFAAPGRLKIWYTSTTKLEPSSEVELERINIGQEPEFEMYWRAFRNKLADFLVSESPKLIPVKDDVKDCLDISEGFLHANLIAHRIRGINSQSRPSLLKSDVAKLKIEWKDTIMALLKTAPHWVAVAASWMVFARRPLRSAELSVAVALSEATVENGHIIELDEYSIPYDMEGDMKQQLGPLISIEQGEIKITHPYVAEVLREWIERKQKDETYHKEKDEAHLEQENEVHHKQKDETHLENEAHQKQKDETHLEQGNEAHQKPKDEPDLKQKGDAHHLWLLLEYLRICLNNLDKDKTIPRSLAYSFFEYALENWHIHYRNIMENAKFETLQLERNNLKQLAYTLFEKPDCIHWLAPGQYPSPESKHQKHAETPSDLEPLFRPALLACRLGLYDILTLMLGTLSSYQSLEPAKVKNLKQDALKVACEYGHSTYLAIFDTVEPAVVEVLLSEACERGDEKVVSFLIFHFLETKKITIPQHLLSNVCSIGHKSVADNLLKLGVKPDTYTKGQVSPLHAAIHRGHLDVVDLLLKNGANVNLVGERDWTPLQCSIRKGYTPISERLLKEKLLQDNINKDHLTSANLAANLGDADLLRRVINLPRSEIPKERGDHLSQSLNEAAANGHLEIVEILKNHGVSINSLNPDKKTALFMALSNNREKVVEYLLKNGATIDKEAKYPESTLKQAIIHGNLAACKTLISLGEDPNGGNWGGSSPLTDAARGDHIGIFKVLIDCHADISRKVTNDETGEIFDENITFGWEAVHFAAYYGSLEIIRLLVKLEPETFRSKTASSHTPLHLAVFKNKVKIVEILLNDGSSAGIADRKRSISGSSRNSISSPKNPRTYPPVLVDALSDKHRTPLHISVANHTFGTVKLLLNHGASASARDVDGKTPLHFAVASPSSKTLKDIINILFSKGADPSARDVKKDTPLHYAARYGNAEAVLLLLQVGSLIEPLNDSGLTPLYIAAKAGHCSVVYELLKRRADANTQSRKGYTALHVAAFSGHVKVVNTLLEYGADPAASDEKLDTPLHEAARRGKDEVVRSLIREGANLDAINSVRVTPLQRAVLNNWPLSAEILLDANANPNIRDEDGDTVLTTAILKNSKSMLDVLLKQEDGKLKYNVELDFVDSQGKTPLMRAFWMPEIIELLLNAGADASLYDRDGRTALHEFARGGVEQVGSLLNRHDFRARNQLERADSEGLTPLHIAARKGNVSLITAFKACGADLLSAKDRQGRTTMHHAVRTLSKDSLIQVFGDFLTPSEGNQVNVPDYDGWTPLHWACRGSQSEVLEMLLSRYKYPLQALRYENEKGWTAMAVAITQGNEDAIDVIQRCAMAMDTDWNNTSTQPPSPFLLPEPPTSDIEAFRGRDVGDEISVLSRHISTEWKTAVRNGLKSDGKKVEVGQRHRGVVCDDCNYDIYGARFQCDRHQDFNLCFKCYWHVKEIHPKDHIFQNLGGGPIQGPIILDIQPEVSSPLSSQKLPPIVETRPWEEDRRRPPLPTQINSINRTSSPFSMGFQLSRRRIRSPSPPLPSVLDNIDGDRFPTTSSRAIPSSISLDANENTADPRDEAALRKDRIRDRLRAIVEREAEVNAYAEENNVGTSDDHKPSTATAGPEAETMVADDELTQGEVKIEITNTVGSSATTKYKDLTGENIMAEEMNTLIETEIELAEELENKNGLAGVDNDGRQEK